MDNGHLHSSNGEPRHKETEKLPGTQQILMPSTQCLPPEEGKYGGSQEGTWLQTPQWCSLFLNHVIVHGYLFDLDSTVEFVHFTIYLFKT